MADDGKKPVKKTGKKTGDYEVGYGKPPVSGRFPPETSGNPSGKKTGKSVAHWLAEIGDLLKTFNSGGKLVTLPAKEALAHKLYTEALKGNAQFAKIILDAEKGVLGVMPFGGGTLSGPEEIEVACTHAEWLKLIEDAKGDHADDDASE